jgi:putative nucleotidyltransferase with HDIG domain
MWQALPQFGLGEGELWRHSVAALLAAEHAMAHFQLPFSTAAVTAALLHDIGKVLMARHLDPETLDYLRLARIEGGHTARGAELEVLTISHAELGAMVAAHWGMPEEIVHTIQFHDEPDGAGEQARNSALVLLADAVAKEVAPPRIQTGEGPEELERARKLLGLPAEAVTAFCGAVQGRYAKIGGAY